MNKKDADWSICETRRKFADFNTKPTTTNQIYHFHAYLNVFKVIISLSNF